MFERITYRADGQEEMVQSLNTILDIFPAEAIEPYRAKLCGEPKNRDLWVCRKKAPQPG
jgi:hypothetical protein